MSKKKSSYYYDTKLIADLEFIRNAAFCFRTAYKACSKFNAIRNQLLPEDKIRLFADLFAIYMDMDNTYGHRASEYYYEDMDLDMKAVMTRTSAEESIFGEPSEREIYLAKTYDCKLKLTSDYSDGSLNQLVADRSAWRSERWHKEQQLKMEQPEIPFASLQQTKSIEEKYIELVQRVLGPYYPEIYGRG